MRTQVEWKVDTQMLSEPYSTCASTLSRISPAALLVKVMAMIFHGFTCFSSIKCAILYVKTLVFPEPAPAITREGPSECRTASCWLVFSSFKKSTVVYSGQCGIPLFSCKIRNLILESGISGAKGRDMVVSVPEIKSLK